MSFLKLIVDYMDEETSLKFQECWNFLKIKNAVFEEEYLSLLKTGDEESICRGINNLRTPGKYSKYHLEIGAFEENWADVFRQNLYLDINIRPKPEQCTTAELYEECRHWARMQAKDTRRNDLSLNFHYLYCCHDWQIYREQGIEACFGEHPGKLWNYYVDTKDPNNDYIAFQGAVVLLNLGLFDRAHDYIEILKKFSQRKWRRGSPGYDPKYYLASIQFLDALLRARTTDDPEEARRHAATAIAANFQSVVDCYNTDTQQGHFYASRPDYALCLAVEFEYDIEWARNCCHSLFSYLDQNHFHAVFDRVVDWNAWMWKPEDHGLLPMQRVREIQEEVRQERYQKERKR